jgi:hypothetical protein
MLATELLRHLPSAPRACDAAEFAGDAGLCDGSERPPPGNCDVLDEFVQAAYSRQSESFLAARSVYREFLGEELSEQAFLCRDIFEYSDDETPSAFRGRVEDAVLAGQPYSAKMGARLESVYSRAFGEPLHPDDRAYGARIARDARAAVSGDAAVRISTRLYEELSHLCDRIAGVYLDVLGRQPDPKELRSEVPAMRSLVPPEFYSDAGWDEKNADDEEGSGGLWRLLAPAAEALRVRLHRSLEFHEVLKGVIAARIAAATGGAPSNRVVFGTLAAVVEGCGGRPETLTEGGNPAAPEAVWLVDLDAAIAAV